MVRLTDAGLRTSNKNTTPQILINLFAKRFRLLDTLGRPKVSATRRATAEKKDITSSKC
ncbi:MAG: hypothetical protein R3Y09_02985 [Clostridia bacterium]